MMTDEEYGTVVLRALDDEPRAPSTVDVTKALVEGRRRRRVRKIKLTCTGGAAAVLLIAGGFAVVRPDAGDGVPTVAQSAPASAPSSAGPTGSPSASAPASRAASGETGAIVAAPTSCSVQVLAVPGGRVKSIVTGGDPTGRYIVGRSYHFSRDSMELKVWIWDDGRAIQVPMPGDDQQLADINTHGVAVGYAWGVAGARPYVYRTGELSPLPGVEIGDAVAVNDAGVIVGNDEAARRPVVWRTPDTPPVSLEVPPGTVGTARDLAADGTVVGSVNERPYAWRPDGKGAYLPDPRADGKGGAATRITGDWAIGTLGMITVGLRWNLRTGTVDEVTQFDGRPEAVSEAGWLTGFDKLGRAILVTPRGTLVMPDLHAHRAGGFTNMPFNISDDGRTIAGQAYEKSVDDNVAVAWNCR
jgi:hypothetical protein